MENPVNVVINNSSNIWVLILVAVIGVLGIALGGLIQLAAQRWAKRHDQMIAIRINAAGLAESLGSYTSILVQSTLMIDKIRDDLKERLKTDNKAKLDLDDDYLERLGTGYFEAFDQVHSQSIELMSVSDWRISDQANVLHLMAVDVQNETGLLYSGSLHIPAVRAKALQTQINTQVSVLMTMVSPRKWEKHFNFRSASKAKRTIKRDHRKLRKQIDAATKET